MEDSNWKCTHCNNHPEAPFFQVDYIDLPDHVLLSNYYIKIQDMTKIPSINDAYCR